MKSEQERWANKPKQLETSDLVEFSPVIWNFTTATFTNTLFE